MGKARVSKFALAAFLAYWMLFGGSLFWQGWTPVLFVASLIVLFIWAAGSLRRRGRLPVLLGPAVLLALAALVSLLANLDIFWISAGWMLVGVMGIEGLLAGAEMDEDELLDVLYISVWIWLAGWTVLRAIDWVDNRNLAAVWPVLAILVILAKRKPGWQALPFIAALVVLGSRGAFLGLGLGLVAWKRPRLDWKKAALLALAGLVLLSALTLFRPQNAFNRLVYWEQAAGALNGARVWFGVGPGGLFARQIITEPGSNPLSYHVHAHNLLVHVLVEWGLAGGVAFLAAAAWVLKAGLRRARLLPLFVAFIGHSLVDLPLYFPGPLLVFMLVAGTLPGRDLLTPLMASLKEAWMPAVSQRSPHATRQGRPLHHGSLAPDRIQAAPSPFLDRDIQSFRR